MLSRELLLSAFLATGAAAQVPYGHFIVSTSGPNIPGTGAYFVDPATGDVTPLLGLETLTPTQKNISVVAIDPTTGNILTSGTSNTTAATMYQIPLQGRVASTITRITWTSPAGIINDALVAGTNVLLAVGGVATTVGLWSAPLNGGAGTQLGSAADAYRVAGDANVAWLLTWRSGVNSTVWKYVAATNSFTQVVTGLPESKCFDLFTGGLLIVGTQTGDLDLADPATGASFLFKNVAQEPIVALRWSQATADLLLATQSGKLFTLANLPTPIASLPRTPTDIDVGRTNVAAFFTFESGCQGTGGFVPAIGATGLPSLGNASFACTVSKGLGGSQAIFALGNSRKDWGGIPLPFDLSGLGAPGCAVAVKGLFLLVVPLSGSGAGGGSATLPLPIPNDPTLLGARLSAQWWCLDSGANALGLSVSEGGEAIPR